VADELTPPEAREEPEVSSAGRPDQTWSATQPIEPAPAPALTPPPRRSIPVGRLVFGLALLAVGVVWLLASLDVVDVRPGIILSVALIAVGVALATVSGSRGHGGLIALGVILTVALTFTTAFDIRLEGGVGDKAVRPTSIEETSEGIHLAVGQLRVDLTGLTLPEGTTASTEITLGIGELIIEVPNTIQVDVRAKVGAGQITLFGTPHDGVNIEATGRNSPPSASGRRLLLTVSVGLGQVTVRELQVLEQNVLEQNVQEQTG
jgi:hypothetical protein